MQQTETPIQTLETIVSGMKDAELIECHANFTASSQGEQSAEERTFDLSMIALIEMEQARRRQSVG